MHFKETVTYPMSIDNVLKMYKDPEFASLRMSKAGLEHADIVITAPTPDSVSITCSAKVDPSTLPPAARHFLSAQIIIKFVEKWDCSSGSKPTATTVLKADGAPIHLHATSILEGDDESTTRYIQGDFTVSIPLLGKAIESKASGSIGLVFRAEYQAAREWLKMHPEL